MTIVDVPSRTTLPPLHRRASRGRSWVRYLPLGLLILVGAGLRGTAMWMSRPAALVWVDSIRFARIDPTGIFDDFWMPAGYAAFLRLIHSMSANLEVTVGVQHLLGIASGVLAYLIVRRLGGPVWLGLLPAAAVLLSGDQIYLEHILMAESLLIFFLLAALYTVVRALDVTSKMSFVFAGCLTASCGLIRSPALALIPIVFVWLVFSLPGEGRKRLAGATVFLLSALLLVTGYIVLAISMGRYSGIADMDGWNLYPRVAPFADCRDFTPPPGTRALCPSSSQSKRPGPDYYVWDLGSRSRENFALSPGGAKPLEAFARQAILHQPLDYLRAVGVDLARYVDPALDGARPYGGEDSTMVSFSDSQPALERSLDRALSSHYSDTERYTSSSIWFLRDYQRLVRVSGWTLLGALCLAVIGLVLGNHRTRCYTALFLLCALALFVIPVMTFTYDYRYGMPPTPLLVIAATCGIRAITDTVFVRGRHSKKANRVLGTELPDDTSDSVAVTGSDPRPAIGEPARSG